MQLNLSMLADRIAGRSLVEINADLVCFVTVLFAYRCIVQLSSSQISTKRTIYIQTTVCIPEIDSGWSQDLFKHPQIACKLAMLRRRPVTLSYLDVAIR